MADSETKPQDEGKPLTDKELEDVSGGIVVQAPDPNQGGIIIQNPDDANRGGFKPR